MRLEIVEARNPLRPGVEALARNVYRREYGADSPCFPDIMLAVLDDAGLPHCVAGFRDHICGFFSEQYVDDAVEMLIARQTGMAVARETIVELGPLAADRPGALLDLLIGFARIGVGSGYRWGIFTATARLRRLAARLGIPLLELGIADRNRVTAPGNWGSYYDSDPRVCAVDGLTARQRLLQSRLPCGSGAAQSGVAA
jgi:hypothetical protein